MSRTAPARERMAAEPDETPQALNVVIVFEDAVTRHWADELWERVGRLLDSGGVCRQSWKTSELTAPLAFAGAVQAAAMADVLVIAVRDRGGLPLNLHVWIDAWLPRRAGRAGAMVALIGVPGEPDVQSGKAHKYLAMVAQRAGLDYMPRERKLPGETFAAPASVTNGPAISSTKPSAGGMTERGPQARLHWRLTE